MPPVMFGTVIPRAPSSPTTGRKLLALTASKTATNTGAEQAYPLYQSGDGINERMSGERKQKENGNEKKKIVD